MKRSAAIALITIMLSPLVVTSVMAEDIIIPLPETTSVEKIESAYQCGQEKVVATYLNAGNISLVRIAFADRIIVASNVMAASGAKYQGSVYVWWSKGDEADLYDLMADAEMKKPVHCTAVKP
ncbi:MliC family protein [Agrobacterium sp. NPDC090273]|uniref:MliC family protein n=1 Tax=Agrobacterium sp. NPDC090273 TaxID=3363919 RepID=UPI00383B7DAF